MQGLTGGTRDVNCQPMKFRITPSAAIPATSVVLAGALSSANCTSVAIPIPVQRLNSGRKAQVMELVKLQWDANLTKSSTASALSAMTAPSLALTLSSRSYGVSSIPIYRNADPFIIYFTRKEPTLGLVAPVAYDSFVNSEVYMPTEIVDFTDGAGHGILYGQDTLYAQGTFTASAMTAATSLTTNSAYNCCLWYRWKNVGFSEYIGMVTAQ